VIIDSKEDFGMGGAIGNVKVTFTDGHTEMWTLQGRSQNPHVSSAGQVGFLLYQKREYRNYPIFDTLRVVWPDEHHRDYKADDSYPYIEQWAFVDDNAAVVIQSRAAHGPADFLKYDLATGKVLGHANAGSGEALPDWAKPYADPSIREFRNSVKITAASLSRRPGLPA